MCILVVGPQSSGSRLLCRVLIASGLDVRHDRSHGEDAEALRAADRVVVITRDPDAQRASLGCHYSGSTLFTPQQTLAAVVSSRTDAFWVTYEFLTDEPSSAIAAMSHWLGISPWEYHDEYIENQNHKWKIPGYHSQVGPAPGTVELAQRNQG